MNREESRQNPNVAKIGRLMRSDLLGGETDNNSRLKLKINNLLWEELPSKRTIGQADVIACEIFKLITNDVFD